MIWCDCGVDISSYARYKTEAEILLPPGEFEQLKEWKDAPASGDYCGEDGKIDTIKVQQGEPYCGQSTDDNGCQQTGGAERCTMIPEGTPDEEKWEDGDADDFKSQETGDGTDKSNRRLVFAEETTSLMLTIVVLGLSLVGLIVVLLLRKLARKRLIVTETDLENPPCVANVP